MISGYLLNIFYFFLYLLNLYTVVPFMFAIYGLCYSKTKFSHVG